MKCAYCDASEPTPEPCVPGREEHAFRILSNDGPPWTGDGRRWIPESILGLRMPCGHRLDEVDDFRADVWTCSRCKARVYPVMSRIVDLSTKNASWEEA